MSLAPPPDVETIVAPSTVDRMYTRTTFEKVAPTVDPLAVDQPPTDVSSINDVFTGDVDRFIESLGDEIPILVELADDSASSKEDTIPQQHEAVTTAGEPLLDQQEKTCAPSTEH